MPGPRHPDKKAVVVGLYGVPGSGKSFLIKYLKTELGQDSFAFYDGSEVIATVVPGGLNAFQKLEEKEKEHWREVAIDKIGKECTESGKVGVVAGHFMFWDEEEEVGHKVCTQHDLDTFTHILYLDELAKYVVNHRQEDATRSRPSVSEAHIDRWKVSEKTELQRLCRDHRILFSPVSGRGSPQPLTKRVSMLLQDFSHHTEEYNLSRAESKLDEVLARQGQVETVMVMDADRTLAAVDTGKIFWERVCKVGGPLADVDTDKEFWEGFCKGEGPLKALFSGPLGYSYTAFRQAVLLYEETADDASFDGFCEQVASEVTMHPEFVSLLHLVAKQEHVGAIVVTCGLRRVWEKVLKQVGLSETVSVIGGERITDGFVVTAAVKAALVARLQDVHHVYVWAFGDSQLDLEMLSKADQAIVVTGEEESRSKTMDTALKLAIDDGLQARQALLPSNATPRLDINTLPLIQLAEPEFLESVLRRRLQVLHATERNATKLMMATMRDAKASGPVLRRAHQRVGWYLATEFLTDLIGIEEYKVQHVQGHFISAHRLLHEQKTSIVALMRGGEPMALGINDAFPLAMFLHASCPDDVKFHHLQHQSTVVLVDSVVNSGKTVMDFVQHIRKLHDAIRIVIVAGVVQAQSIFGGNLKPLGRCKDISLVALRLSDNKFTGSGTTDTGNRLYNTTHLV
ncbi:hypothetical protein K504DRAFT_440355 [Pleomassaria siparia CBS 279.74]|uniref:Phosphoribosyltransferase domain-containing protein n=1 Tax=Pleomassaria siparia CBS 279.74 TaxID=1314801 RepID=A0A6G1JXD8_9PLEO|nr:hypothetical protein K504DRAFT_440355 [Pleomassaria siparia CBS 279.74]